MCIFWMEVYIKIDLKISKKLVVCLVFKEKLDFFKNFVIMYAKWHTKKQIVTILIPFRNISVS